jgi:putative DNA primase/helicase
VSPPSPIQLPRLAEGASLPDAAVQWAAAGWRVHPCSPSTKKPLLARDKDPVTGEPIDGTGWGLKASADSDVVTGYWKRWPKAMIGVATGDDRVFVVDFDPRVDKDTGEIWTLEQLRADTEALIGCTLPQSVSSMTRSGGIHLWLRWPDDGGAPITNRGNLPDHVDVRGKGGFVIVPPSVMTGGAKEGGGRYRWLKGRAPGEIEIADAPAELVALVRGRRKDEGAGEAPRAPAGARQSDDDPQAEAQRKYAVTALDAICRRIRVPGAGRNDELNAGAFAAAQLVAAGAIDETIARASIEAAARDNPGRDGAAQIRATIDSGWNAGLAAPKDMSQVGARAGRGSPQRAPREDRRPRSREEGHGLPRNTPASRRAAAQRSTLPDGRQVEPPTAGEKVALVRRGGGWLRSRLNGLPPYDGSEGAREAGEKLAYSLGRKFAGGWIEPLVASLGRWALMERVGGTSLNALKVEKAVAEGQKNPAGVPTDWLVDLRCARFPLTDMGNAERFVARWADDFRFTTAKGWMGWDGRRWRLLDQEKDTTPAEVMAAVFATVRGIQDEARIVRESGTLDEGGLDMFIIAAKGKPSRLSREIETHGRSSEGSGRIGCIANLAKRWLTVSIEDFDTDPFAINCLNGTIRIERGDDGVARAVHHPHRREDLIAKLAPVVYWPGDTPSPSPLFTGLIEWAQPDPATRRYVQQWMGYSASGHVGAQILHFWYGLGGNGKSAVIDTCHAALGDYADTIGIETFLDQGIKKRGDAATPDLADLGGVRGLRTSEPRRGAKIDAALIKLVTGGEPMKVRALHKGFFPLRPQFKLTISGNHKLEIPDTDEGIWRRLKLVPWDQAITADAKDEDLVDKIKGLFPGVDGELDGVFAWLIDGLVDWRNHGFVESAVVREATTEFRQDSDPLARFLRLCTERTAGDRVQSSALHAVFCAWAKAAGETEWKQKGFTQAMKAKGFENKQSNGMFFLDLKLVKQVTDFVDEHGHVIALEGAGSGSGGEDGRPFAPPDDDYDDGFGDAGGARPSWRDRD